MRIKQLLCWLLALLLVAVFVARTTPISIKAAGTIIVTPTSGLETTDLGGTATFTIALGSQPTKPVKINLSSSDTSEGTIDVVTINLTPGN